jgi:hypothetical protein
MPGGDASKHAAFARARGSADLLDEQAAAPGRPGAMTLCPDPQRRRPDGGRGAQWRKRRRARQTTVDGTEVPACRHSHFMTSRSP